MYKFPNLRRQSWYPNVFRNKKNERLLQKNGLHPVFTVMTNRCIAEEMRPKTWNDFVGHPLAVSKVQTWCKQHNRRGILLISGSSGVGKTSLAAIALSGARTPYVLDPSASETSLKSLVDLACQAAHRRPLDGTPPLGIVIDDIDGGGYKPSDVISASSQYPTCPFVITCRDPQSTDGLRKLVKSARVHVSLAPAGRNETQKLLIKLCQTLKVKLNHAQVLHIHEKSHGDLRQAILLGEIESRGGPGGCIVTKEGDSKLSASQETDLLVACSVLGLPGIHPKASSMVASACVQSDPMRCFAMVHELGLETMMPHDRKSNPKLVYAWSDVCDDLCAADVMERRGGGEEAYELVGNAIPYRSSAIWGAQPPKITPRSASKLPAMFTFMSKSSVHTKCHRAMRRFVPSEPWLYPIAPLMKHNDQCFPMMVKAYDLTEDDIDIIGKSLNLSKDVVSSAKKCILKVQGTKRKRK